jgi:peptide/nickel transport system substrate-binding protein
MLSDTRPLLFILLAFAAFAGCDKDQRKPASSPTPNAAGGEFRLPIVASTALQTLDPIQSVEVTQYDIDNQIFEGLVSVDMQGAIAPALAANWENSSDYRIWKFRLRDCRFADDSCFKEGKGRTVTASDVLFSLRRGLDPAAGSKNSWALSRSVLGAAEYAAGKSKEIPGLRALDEKTVEIELARGDRYFLPALTVPSTYVVAPEGVSTYGAQFGLKPVGTGPFKVSEWSQGEHVLLVRNENYGQGVGWQPPKPHIDRAKFVFYRSEAQVIAAFERNEIDFREVLGVDVATAKSPDIRASLHERFPSAQIVDSAQLCKVHLLAPMMGPNYPFGGPPEIRQALSELFPRAESEKAVLRGLGKEQVTLLPAMVFSGAKPPAKLADAKQILQQSISGKTIRVAFVSTRINDVLIQQLKSILEEAGADVVLFPNTSISALFSSLSSTRPDFTLIYWSPYFPNLPEYLTALLTESQPVPNFTGFSDKKLDELAAELRAPTGRGADAIAPEIDQVLGKMTPWIPIYIETPLYLSASNVEGFAVNPVSVTQLSAISLKPKQ